MTPFRAQLRAELQMTFRQGEQLLVSLGIPLLVLVFFSLVDVLPTGVEEPADFLAPGVVALAVMSTAMVSLGIGAGFERHYRVLKRLGTTPLGRPRWVAAKAVTVAVVELVQLALLVPIGLALGWSPDAGAMAGVAALGLGTLAFAGIGLLMAGTLSGPATLAVANGAYLAMLLVGGMVVPLNELPAGLEAIARILPAAALSECVHGTLGVASAGAGAWLVLTTWAVAAPLAAIRSFRWE